MFKEKFLKTFAIDLQHYNSQSTTDKGIPGYINAVLQPFNQLVDEKVEKPNGKTFQSVLEDSKKNIQFSKDFKNTSKSKGWATAFALGALATQRRSQISFDSPEVVHINKIIKGLQQIWVQGIRKAGVTAIDNVLNGVKDWIDNLDPNTKDFQQSVIAAMTIVNLAETKLSKGVPFPFNQLSWITDKVTFAQNTLADAKRTLMLKCPQLAISFYKNDTKQLLPDLFTQHPAIALNLLKQNPELVAELNIPKRLNQTFSAFLGKYPDLAFQLLETAPEHLQDFIVSALLQRNPDHVAKLVTKAPEALKTVLDKDRKLVNDIRVLQKTESAQKSWSDDVKTFMQPYQVKTTSDILLKLGAEKGKLTLKEAAAKDSEKHSGKVKQFEELHQRLERLDAFGAFSRKQDWDILKTAYGKENKSELVEAVCQDLGLDDKSVSKTHLLSHANATFEKSSDKSWGQLFSTFGSMLATTVAPEFSGGTKTLGSILESDEVINAYVSATLTAKNEVKDLENDFGLTTKTEENNIKKLKDTISHYEGKINTLDTKIKKLDDTLPEVSLEDWLGANKEFMEALNKPDKKGIESIKGPANALKNVLGKYLVELERLNEIAQDAEKLASDGLDVTALSASLDQYIEAVYQQGKTLYGEAKPENYSTLSNQAKINFMKERIGKETKTIDSWVNALENVQKHQEIADQKLIDSVRDIIKISKESPWHKILMIFPSSYNETFTSLKQTVNEYDKIHSTSEQSAKAIAHTTAKKIMEVISSGDSRFSLESKQLDDHHSVSIATSTMGK